MRSESCMARRSRRLTLISCAVLAVWGAVFLAAGAEARPAGAIHIRAWYFDRGNAGVFANPDIYADYRDKYPELVVGDGGKSPWAIEYDIDFPVDAAWTLHVRYGSPAPRPLEVWLDGKRVGQACGRVTGNPPPYPDRHPRNAEPRREKGFHGVEWEEGCKLTVTKGRHTLKFTRKGLPPRLSALRLDSPVAFPKGSKLRKLELNLERIPPELRRIFLPAGSVNPGALRLAIEDMTAQYGPRYPKGKEYLKQLDELIAKQKAAKGGTPEQAQKVEKALAAIQSQTLLAHPLLKFDKLLFLKRGGWGSSHVYNNYGGGGMGSSLCILSPVRPDGKITDVAPELTEGLFGQFDLSFDAKKVVFAYIKNEKTRYRIYEMGIDGKGVHQLTFEADQADKVKRYKHAAYGNYFDMDPCYLPDGNIMFVSTRSQRAVSCHPSIVTSLYVMNTEGANMRCLSGGQFTELDPRVLADGRVVYMRWEYVDKGFGNVQSLWSVRPDGSGVDHVYKNNVVLPAAMIHARSIPGSQKLVTIATAHGGAPAGPVVIVDNRRSRRSAEAMTNITPEIGYPGMGPRTNGRGVFRHPYPLSEKLFLVAHHPQTKGSRYGIYVLDAWGNRALLYGDPETSCYQPVVLEPRPRPTIIAPIEGVNDKDSRKPATMFVQDVYQGLTGVKRGTVKYIRVMEVFPTTWEQAVTGPGAGLQAVAVSYKADVGRKKVHGISTVYEDGSAYFTVPPNTNIFFQALDENYMEIHRMRTFINLMPGEQRSCVGCHEPRRQAPVISSRPIAMNHPAKAPSPQPGDTGPRMVHYESDVQPILDKHCIGCHSGAKPKGDLDLSGTPRGLWNRAYVNLIDKNLLAHLDGGFGSANVPSERPMTFGSHRSKMVARIRKDPCKAKLTRNEFIRIVTWVDANAPYYGTHKGCKHAEGKDRPNFRPQPVAGK